MTPNCPNCGESFEQIGTHWHHNGYPDIEHHEDSLIGMALGDGSFDGGSGESRLGFIMTNKQFLDWYREQLDWLATDVRVHRTSSELADMDFGPDNPDNLNTAYVLRTRNHPAISKLHDRFVDETRMIAPDLDLSWEILRYWYVCDGHREMSEKAANPRITIGATNYMDQEEKIMSMFDRLGLDARVYSNVIRLGVDSTQKFFNHTEPLPGFGHKWSDG